MRFYYATFLWWNGGGGMHQWNAHRHHHSRMYRIWYKLSHIVLPSRQQVRCFLALAFVNNWQFHSLDRMTKQIQSFQESQSLPPSDNSSFLPWNSHTTFVDLKPILQVSYFAGNYMELYSLRARPGTARALSLSSPNHPFCWYPFFDRCEYLLQPNIASCWHYRPWFVELMQSGNHWHYHPLQLQTLGEWFHHPTSHSGSGNYKKTCKTSEKLSILSTCKSEQHPNIVLIQFNHLTFRNSWSVLSSKWPGNAFVNSVTAVW
jgi:hypothetical protein